MHVDMQEAIIIITRLFIEMYNGTWFCWIVLRPGVECNLKIVRIDVFLDHITTLECRTDKCRNWKMQELKWICFQNNTLVSYPFYILGFLQFNWIEKLFWNWRRKWIEEHVYIMCLGKQTKFIFKEMFMFIFTHPLFATLLELWYPIYRCTFIDLIDATTDKSSQNLSASQNTFLKKFLL